jgi:hypothetical protein
MSGPPWFCLSVIYTPERSDMKHLIQSPGIEGRISPSCSAETFT